LKLSAGRVQTPTLSILVDREKQIKKFVPKPYWLIKAVINDEIVADHVEGKIFDKERAENIYKNCKGSDATVKSVKINKTIRKPPVPFNLGGLQSAAYSAFGFSPKKTQTIAQNLYTGGYTSYPRTSSQKLPKSLNYKNILIHLSANPEFKKHIIDLPKELKPREGKKKDAAHPAIHPTGVLPEKLDKDEKKVYELIVYRFISVFCDDSELETMKVNLNVAKEEFEFKRKRVSKMGWLAHYPFKKIEADSFPDLKKGDLVRIKDITSEEKETKPPARYNEASLIKELEKRELGTKATRADIIAKLYDRKYISGKKIEVNQLGENMIDTLQEYCKDITSEELTRNFEKDLEKIQENKITKEEVVDNAHKEVVEIVKDIHKNEEEIGSKLYSAYMKSQIVGKCACGGDLIKRYSPKTKAHFVGCSNYPDCKVIYNLPKGANFLKQKCPKCGLPIISFGKPRQHACLDPNCGKENVKKLVQFIAYVCKKHSLLPFDRSGVKEIIEYSSRSAEDQNKLTAIMQDILDLIIESSFIASSNRKKVVSSESVIKALEAKAKRSSKYNDYYNKMIQQGDIIISTDGYKVGQINGLTITIAGDCSFGQPVRITANTYIGKSGVLNIEREVRMSGTTHSKGVFILSAYIGEKYAQEVPLSLTASLCFEQLYNPVDGDSASSTELYAILSSLAGVPINQSLAVTGSVNQKGEIQAIGGVNEKIEGYFEICKLRGLTGEQGVMIPRENIQNLNLSDEVVEAVKNKKFHIYAVSTIDEGIEVLTGVPAGDINIPGTVNYEAYKTLKRFAKIAAEQEK